MPGSRPQPGRAQRGDRRRSARQAADSIIGTLLTAGHQALLAGGCVRDVLLGRPPKDFDIATSARPRDILQLFPRGQKVGAHFGVIIVRRFGHMIEVATFRSDGAYSDGRHPDYITFADAEADARRRDFTINGMFLDTSTDRVIDYVGGRRDLENRVVQAIGNPEHRFEEDHLRMLRAVRIATELDFLIEQETFEALYSRAERLRRVSPERIREELERILSHPRRAGGFQLLADTQLLPHVWTRARWSTQRVQQSRAALDELGHGAGFALAMTAALHHHAPDAIDTMCRDLSCSNTQRRHCVWLSRSLAAAWEDRIRTLADLKLLMASSSFADLPPLFAACLAAQDLPRQRARDLERRAAAVAVQHIAPPPWVTGDDLIRLGLQPGPLFKRVLQAVYYEQLNMNLADGAAALQLARRIANEELQR